MTRFETLAGEQLGARFGGDNRKGDLNSVYLTI
jgi:hypothetical protein